MKPLAEIRGRSRDSVRAGALRRSDLEAFGSLLGQGRRGPGPRHRRRRGAPRRIDRAGQRQRRGRRANGSRRLRPRGADACGCPRPRRRARPARVPAGRSEGAGDPAAARPRRPRLGEGDRSPGLHQRRPARHRRQGADRLDRLPPRRGQIAQRLRPRRPPRPAARRRERRPAGRRFRGGAGARLRRLLAGHGPCRASPEEGAFAGSPGAVPRSSSTAERRRPGV